LLQHDRFQLDSLLYPRCDFPVLKARERGERKGLLRNRWSSPKFALFRTTSSERIRKYDLYLYNRPKIEEMRQLDNAISNRSVKEDSGGVDR
jgi:hypothetical protein